MGESLRTVDCANLTTREINKMLRDCSEKAPGSDLTLINTDSRHNLVIGITDPLDILLDGNVGYYCGGLCDKISLTINGDCGWGLAENLMGGKVVLTGSAGSSAGATIHGGMVVIRGNAGARCGIAMKGGTIVVGGNVGYMTGFMMQKGVIIVGGDAGEAFGDSLYEGKLYIRGTVKALGSDVVEAEITEDDCELLTNASAESRIDFNPSDFRKFISGKKLYNFSSKEKEIWNTAL